MIIQKNSSIIGSKNQTILLDYFYDENLTNIPIIIYLHGFCGFKDWGNFDLIAEQFARHGFFFVKFNFSHNGTTLETPEDFNDLEAFGNNNISHELTDTNCIINWLFDTNNEFNQLININKITLLGHSKGGGTAILKANEDKRITSLITWASIAESKTPWGNMKLQKLNEWKQNGVFYYLNKRTNQSMPIYFQLYEDYAVNEEKFNIEKAIKNLSIPILICHGNQDAAVAVTQAIQLNKWNTHSTLFLIESDHVFGRKHPWLLPELPKPMQDVVNESIRFLKEIN
jgi:uncharacterized protein